MRTDQRRQLAVAAAAGAAVLLVAIAAGASIHGRTGRTRLTSLAAVGDIGAVLVVAVLVAVAGLLVWSLRPRRRRRKDPDEPEWVQVEYPQAWWERALDLLVLFAICAAVAAVIVLVVLHLGTAGTSGSATSSSTTFPVHPPGTSPLAPRPRSSGSVSLGSWTAAGIGVAILAGVLLLAGIARTVRRRLHRGPPLRPLPGPGGTQLARAAAEALDELRAEPDPRRAVIRAYEALERGAVVHDRERAPHEAPHEYLDRLLVKGVPEEPAARLTELFEQARFSDHPIRAEQRDRAIAALEHLRVTSGAA